MIAQILGNYFVDKGLLTKGQLQNVLKKQSGIKVRLGSIAVSEGLMTLAQADAVNMLQQSIDKPFGDIAIDKGYLTETQLKSLLREQGNEYILFMQNLNDDGLIDVPAFENAVQQFKIDAGITTTMLEAMKAGSIDAIIDAFVGINMPEYSGHAGIGVRLVVRLVNKDAYIGRGYESDDVSTLDSGVFQKVNLPDGSFYYTGLTDKSSGLHAIARGFAKDQFEEDELFVIDIAGEFLNCINGLFCTTMDSEDTNYEIEPQMHLSADQIPSAIQGTKALHIPIYIDDSETELVFIE